MLVSKITRKLLSRFSRNSVKRWQMSQWRNDGILGGNPDMDLDPESFSWIFTTLGHGHTGDGWVTYVPDCQQLPTPGCKLYDIHMNDLGGGLHSPSASILVIYRIGRRILTHLPLSVGSKIPLKFFSAPVQVIDWKDSSPKWHMCWWVR